MKIKLLKERGLLFSIVVSISVLIVALSVAYYFVIFLPSKEKARQEQINKELEIKQTEQEFQEKQLQIYEDCDSEAQRRARELLESKIEVSRKAGQTPPLYWKEAFEQGLYLRDDYNEYYNSCLRRHGIKY